MRQYAFGCLFHEGNSKGLPVAIVLQKLDGRRKGAGIQFLQGASFAYRDKPLVDLSEANLGRAIAVSLFASLPCFDHIQTPHKKTLMDIDTGTSLVHHFSIPNSFLFWQP